MADKRQICIIINNRANYGRIKSVIRAVTEHPRLELRLVVGASALLHRFGNVQEVIEQDGFEISDRIHTIVEGETPVTMAKSTGLAIIELATVLANLQPDIVLSVADRFETLATAVAASYMNIPLAHTQGGEVTGSIDESVRHAITKLAHIHFPATELAARNVIRLGEAAEMVFCTGCPSIDMICDLDLTLPPDIFDRYKGVGADLDPARPYVVVLQHPVTTEYGSGIAQINETIEAVHGLDTQTVWLWPNVDAGSDDISKGIRRYRERCQPEAMHFYRNFSVEDYARLLANAQCIIGNSSSALREGSFLGLPAVNIGTRQAGRECGSNVTHVGYDRQAIREAAVRQIEHGRYPSSTLFGDGKAGERIAAILETVDATIQKRLTYDDRTDSAALSNAAP